MKEWLRIPELADRSSATNAVMASVTAETDRAGIEVLFINPPSKRAFECLRREITTATARALRDGVEAWCRR